MIDPLRLVAHRGEMRHYPENSLPALRAAIGAGARHVEFDVQFSSDGVPVVLHDPDLLRVAGIPREIAETDVAALATIELDTDAGPACTVPLLIDTVNLLNEHPGVHAFVELKRHGIERLGLDNCLKHVGDVLSTSRFPWTLISFRDDAVRAAAPQLGVSAGWVLREHSPAARRKAEAIEPDYLFCNVEALDFAREPLWDGPWKWVLYDLNDACEARALLDRGVDMIETGNILEFLSPGGPFGNPVSRSVR